MSLMGSKKKKTRVHASGNVKKKRKQVHVIRDNFSSPAKRLATEMAGKKSSGDSTPVRSHGPIMIVTNPGPIMVATRPAPVKIIVTPKPAPPEVSVNSGERARLPEASLPPQTAADSYKRSRRLGPPISKSHGRAKSRLRESGPHVCIE